jgi:hypothetical protein
VDPDASGRALRAGNDPTVEQAAQRRFDFDAIVLDAHGVERADGKALALNFLGRWSSGNAAAFTIRL